MELLLLHHAWGHDPETMRRFHCDTLVIASHNAGKVGEIADILRPYVGRVLSAGDLGLPEPDETGTSFRANAELKARTAARASGRPALADDSGLVVPALGGAPGIYSARWAGAGRDFAAAMTRIEEKLRPDSDRRAQLVCSLSLAWPDGHCETVEGRTDGRLVWPPRGNGPGYDPIFLPAGGTQTFGELPAAEKHRLSARAAAFRQLVECFDPSERLVA